MNKTKLIIQREYLSRVKKKSFIAMTILGPILIAGLFALGIFLGMSDSSVYKVLVVDQTPQLSDGQTLFTKQFKETSQVKFQYTTDGLSNAAFDSSAYDVMLVLREDIITFPEAELVFRELPSLKARSYIKSEVEKVIENEKLKLNDIDKSVYDSIRTDLDLVSIDAKDGTESSKQEQAIVGFVFAVLIYMFIFLYGVQVMRGVMEEKSNRIVEVIISSVKPFQLMMGKIVGVAMVGLTQILVWIIFSGILITVLSTVIMPGMVDVDTAMQEVQVTQEVAEDSAKDPMNQAFVNDIVELVLFRINWGLMLGIFVFYFLGGYLLYASLFAAVGPAVDNETDTQQFMVPITLPLVFGFIVAEFALANPAGNAVFWFSQVPLTSPVVMMVRVAMGFDTGTIWQLLLSMTLLVLGFLGAVWLAGKIYRVGILMYGKKVTYKELWKWLKF
ncbi:MAG TPA: ABC transporter permease [Cryomorphaceae bacterium]|nr:ABC transporter permease [Cryomorphaceae bacterium]